MTTRYDEQFGRDGHERDPGPDDGDLPTIRLREPAGVVAAVPYLLGFVPRRSLVVVGIGSDRQVGPTVRCDLDVDTDLDPGPDVALDVALDVAPWPGWEHLQRLLLRNGCRSGVVLLYTDRDPADLPPQVTARLLRLLRPPDVATVLEVLDLVVVGPTRFRSALCQEQDCCPDRGTLLGETVAHPVAAAFVLSGRSPATARGQVQLPDAAVRPRERATAREAARRAAARRRSAGTTANGREDLALFDQWCACLADDPDRGPDAALAGRLAAGWSRSSRLRDACMTVFLPGGRCAGLDVLVGPDHAQEGFGTLLDDPGCAGAELGAGPVLRRLAALVEGRERAAVLASHAWLCWVSGDGVSAGVLAERAQLDDPAQRLAALVLQCLDHGVGAPWTRPAPWR